MTLRIAIDFGTSNTCAAVSLRGAAPQVVVVDGAPLVPSAVYAAPDGTLFVGHDAERQAAIDPSRYEPSPKRRIDEGELLLGDAVVPVRAVVRALLIRMLVEARRVAGGAPVDDLVLTHPAEWGAVRIATLREAAGGLARRVVLVAEPVAAALFHVRHLDPRATTLAVLDLGAGTVDASVVARRGSGFAVLAWRGNAAFGGADIDQTLLDHVGVTAAAADPAAWNALVAGHDLAHRRRRRVLRADVRTAKETLSRHAFADVPLPEPFPDAHLTRRDLERLVGARLAGVVDLLAGALADVGVERPDAVFLVGGSSRIPLVARLVHERLAVAPVTLDQPETVVVRGALAVPAPPVARPAPQPTLVPPVARPAPRPPPMPPPVAHPVPPPSAPPLAPLAMATQPTPALSPAARRRRRGAVAGALLVVAGAVIAGVLVLGGERDPVVVARHDFRFTLPDGWVEAGGEPALLRMRITPRDAAGPEAILVQETRLGYDTTAAPERGTWEIAEQLAAEDPAEYFGFQAATEFAGRGVAHYRQRPGDGSMIDWYVVFERAVQVNVGCRGTRDVPVTAACHEVIASLDVSS